MNNETRTRWTDILVVVGGGVLGGLHFGKTGPILPALRAEYDLDLVAAGWAVSLFAGVAVLFGMVAGAVGDRIGHRRLALAGLGAFALGSLIGGFAPTRSIFFASRLVEGFGYLLFMVTGPSLIVPNAFGNDRRLALGLWAGSVPTGIAFVALVAPSVAAAVGWQVVWHAATLATVAWLVWVASRPALRIPTASGAAAEPMTRGLIATVSSLGPWLVAGAFFLNLVIWIPLASWLPSILIEVHAVDAAWAAILTAIVVFVNAPGNVLGGWLMYRGMAPSRVIMLAGIVMGVTGVGMCLPELPGTVRYALCVVFSFMGGALPAAVFALAPVVAPSPRDLGSTTGFLIQGANLGLFVGPPLIGWIALTSGAWEGALWPIVVVTAAIVVLGWRVGAEERRARPA